MLIVGELINASRKAIKDVIETQNSDAIAAIARDQKGPMGPITSM